MIKAEINENGVEILISRGDPSLINELSRVMAKGVDVLSEELGHGSYESAFFATMMSAIDRAKEYGYKIDRKSLGFALMAYKD